MIKAVIFDWDGVISDSMESMLKWYSVLTKRYSLENPLKTRKDWHDKFFEPYPEFYKQMGLDWENDRDEVVQFFKEFIKKEKVSLFDGIVDLLKELKEKGFLIAIGSSNREKIIKNALERYNIIDFFDYITGHEDNFDPKPSPDLILLTSGKIGVKTGEVVYIGDSPEDIQSAKSAGAKSIAVTWGFYPREKLKKERPDFIVGNIEELKKVILDGRL